MSYSEINDTEGLNYGGMPDDRLLEKMEETDPDLVSEVRGADEFHAKEDDYDDYVRSEIVDWTPEAPYLESDHPVRDPSVSRSTLNLRYNGTRGSNPELPRHPELFIGFTGNDARGRENDPRFDQMRGQMTSRAVDVATRMGNNDEYTLAERPWTNQAISYAMKDIQNRVKRELKVFSTSKEGRIWGNNTATDHYAASDVRADAMRNAGEGFDASRGADGAHFFAGDQGSGADADSHVRGHRGDQASQPWHKTTGDLELGVQQYGASNGGGRSVLGSNAVGGGRATRTAGQQDWAASQTAKSTNRKALGATMALAARHRQANAARQTEHDHGTSHETRVGATPTPGDVTVAFRRTVEEQARDYAPGEHGLSSRGKTGAPSSTLGRAMRQTRSATTPNDHLTNAAAIATGLRSGSAAGKRRIKSMVAADGIRNDTAQEGHGGARRAGVPTLAPHLATLSQNQVIRAAAAEGLEVHVYGAAAPKQQRMTAGAQKAYDDMTWAAERERATLGASAAPAHRGGLAQTALGADAFQVFGAADDVGRHHGGAAAMGSKSVRAGAWTQSASLSEDPGDFGDAD